MKMPDSITDGPQYDDDFVEIPTDPKAIQAAKLNAVLEDIALPEKMACPKCGEIELAPILGGIDSKGFAFMQWECMACHAEVSI